MIRDGKPFIPPLCPAHRSGGEFDITPDKFVLYVDKVEDDSNGQPTQVEVAGVYYSSFDDPELLAVISTAVIDEPINSSIATDSLELHPGTHTIPHPHMGEVFCDRIMNCHGLRENGECWALGAIGLREAITQQNGPTAPGQSHLDD